MKTSVARIAWLLTACVACGSDKVTAAAQLEALPVSAATVQAAIELMTAVPIPVAAECTGNPMINCVGDVPGATISIPVSHTTPTVIQTSPGHYVFGTDLTISGAPGIPVTYSGVNCTIVVNTTQGTSSTVHLGGTATFASNELNSDVIDRLNIAPTLSGVEDADIAVTGGTGCSLGTFFNGLIIDSFVTQFEQLGGALCGAPGPTLFKACPVSAHDRIATTPTSSPIYLRTNSTPGSTGYRPNFRE